MSTNRATHGCGQVTMNNIDYMILIGGTDGNNLFSDIIYFNIAQKLWEMTVQIPNPIGEVKGVISLQLDSNGCNLMILYLYPKQALYFCVGDYEWIFSDTAGMFDQSNKFAIVGANELLPCGIE